MSTGQALEFFTRVLKVSLCSVYAILSYIIWHVVFNLTLLLVLLNTSKFWWFWNYQITISLLVLWSSNFLTVHSHCAVHGVEYAFGAHDYPTSGVFEVEPRQCPGFKFRRSIFIGTTSLDPTQVREFMELQSLSYNGDTYHLIVKNCNHFCRDICYKLTGKSIPKWVNRLAKIGILSSPTLSTKNC